MAQLPISKPAPSTATVADGGHVNRIPALTPTGLMDAVPMPLLVCDPGGDLVAINRCAREALGRDPVGLIGQSLTRLFVDPDVGTRLRELIADLGPPGGAPAASREVELSWRLANGNEQRLCWTLAWASDLVVEQRLVFSGVLVGGSRRLSQQVDQVAQRCEAIASATADAIVLADDDGNIVSVNPATERLFGYSAQALLGRRIDLFLNAEAFQARGAWLEQVLFHPSLGRRGSDNEFIARRSNGETFPCDLSLVERTIGGYRRHILVMRNASERRRAEQEVARMRLDMKSIIDSMPSVLVGVDLDCRITSWNKQAQRRTGVPAARALGRPFREFFPELEQRLGEVRDAIQACNGIETRRIALREGGRIRHLEVMVYPLLARGTEGAVIRVDDVSTRVQMEQTLVQSEKMRSLGGLAAGMAHEINNPLGVIAQSSQNASRRLSADLERNRELAAEVGVDFDRMLAYLDARGIPAFLDAIREAAARASHIVTDMLRFSRGSEVRRSACSLQELVETALRLAAADYDLRTRHRFRDVRLTRDYADDLPAVVCDPTGVEQVVLNLVRNAVQAMALAEVAEPRIELRTEHVADRVRLMVRDNGPGIPEAVRRRVFEPFFTTKEVGVGTGLGLSVSYYIITQQHRGSLAVQSDEGAGACFTLELPIAEQR